MWNRIVIFNQMHHVWHIRLSLQAHFQRTYNTTNVGRGGEKRGRVTGRGKYREWKVIERAKRKEGRRYRKRGGNKKKSEQTNHREHTKKR